EGARDLPDREHRELPRGPGRSRSGIPEGPQPARRAVVPGFSLAVRCHGWQRTTNDSVTAKAATESSLLLQFSRRPRPKAQGPRPKAQSPKPKAQGPEGPKAQSPKPKAQRGPTGETPASRSRTAASARSPSISRAAGWPRWS